MIYLSFLRSAISALLYPIIISCFALVIVILGWIPGFREFQDQVVGLWAKSSLWIFGVSIKVNGIEKLPKSGYIGLFNHTSNFDILAVQSLIPRIRFGAKIELFKIPIFGHAMAAAKALPISRSQRSEVMKVYEEAEKRLAQGECFILSPEGTRQKEEKLGPFKSGPFLFAISAQVPVVPVAIKGASKIQAKGSFLPNSFQWVSTIEVTICDPILTTGLNADSKKDLQNKVYKSLLNLGLN